MNHPVLQMTTWIMSRDSRVLLAKRALETTLDPQRHGGSASRSVTTSYHPMPYIKTAQTPKVAG